MTVIQILTRLGYKMSKYGELSRGGMLHFHLNGKDAIQLKSALEELVSLDPYEIPRILASQELRRDLHYRHLEKDHEWLTEVTDLFDEILKYRLENEVAE